MPPLPPLDFGSSIASLLVTARWIERECVLDGVVVVANTDGDFADLVAVAPPRLRRIRVHVSAHAPRGTRTRTRGNRKVDHVVNRVSRGRQGCLQNKGATSTRSGNRRLQDGQTSTARCFHTWISTPRRRWWWWWWCTSLSWQLCRAVSPCSRDSVRRVRRWRGWARYDQNTSSNHYNDVVVL